MHTNYNVYNTHLDKPLDSNPWKKGGGGPHHLLYTGPPPACQDLDPPSRKIHHLSSLASRHPPANKKYTLSPPLKILYRQFENNINIIKSQFLIDYAMHLPINMILSKIFLFKIEEIIFYFLISLLGKIMK